MTDQQLLSRITLDPKVMVGKPVISGTRLTVEYILNLLGHGETAESIIWSNDRGYSGELAQQFTLP